MTVAAPPGAAPPPKHHGIYAALVQNDADLVGHVAYALYKRDKLKFCESEMQRIGAIPAQDSLDTFIRGCKIDSRINAYRQEAERLLEQMTEFVIEGHVEHLEETYNQRLIAGLKEGRSWWRAVGENFVGSVVVALVWALLVFVIAAAKVGPDKVLGDVFDKDISDRRPSSAPASSPSR